LRLFSCGHVVDPSHVKAMVVTRGPSGAELQFTSDRRLSVEVVDSLHGVLLQLCRCVPGGVVVFFTSYAYMESVLARWRCNNGHLLNQLHAVKPVFVEKSSKGSNNNGNGNEGGKESAASDSVWEAYSRQIRQSSSATTTSTNPHKGGMLFSVIGGTLSEGINFSDDLARCVVVVGMPYPDHRDVVFQQKMQFNAERVKAAGTSSMGGNSLLDTLCMKAVNQSIGECVCRHCIYSNKKCC
jgi:chromosome transmission fidelity protein 1